MEPFRVFVSYSHQDVRWVEDGELVRFGFECDRDNDRIDGACGCRRSMCGIISQKATTTMKVVDRPDLTKEDYITELIHSMIAAGWGKANSKKLRQWVEVDAKELLRIAAYFKTGTIVEKRGNKFQERFIKIKTKA